VQRFYIFTLLALIARGQMMPAQEARQAAQGEFSQDHVAWVAQALIRMGTIKPGMTRQELLTVFTIEGGLSTGLQRTFVSRDCPYFKIDVQFKAVGRQDRDREGRVTLVEDSKDIVVKISRPYLQFSVLD
jgi:hypothetical protein